MRRRPPLVLPVGIGVQIADGDGFHPEPPEARRLPLDVRLLRAGLHAAIGPAALGHLEPHLARDDRPGANEFRVKQAVGAETLRSADLQDVAEAPRRQNRGARPRPLQYRVGADGGAVRDPANRGDVQALYRPETPQ